MMKENKLQSLLDAEERLPALRAATRKIESDNLSFDDVVQICLLELKKWPQGSTDGGRTELANFLRSAERRARQLIVQ
jgi:hypothetical protein